MSDMHCYITALVIPVLSSQCTAEYISVHWFYNLLNIFPVFEAIHLT